MWEYGSMGVWEYGGVWGSMGTFHIELISPYFNEFDSYHFEVILPYFLFKILNNK